MSAFYRRASFEEVWVELRDGIEQIYRLQPMTVSRQMQLHTLVYNYCTSSPGRSIQPRHSMKIADQPSSGYPAKHINVTSNVIGAELYFHLKDYLQNHVESLAQSGIGLQGEDLLRFYDNHWKNYQFSSKVMHSCCSYLDQHWVRREREAGNKDVYELDTLALVIWKEVFFKLFSDQVTRASLDLIKAERNKELIQSRLIGAVIQSYVSLGFENNPTPSTNSTELVVPTLGIYQDYFEEHFLRETKEFYRLEAASLTNDPIIDYLNKVTQRTEEEVYRVHSYLHPSTLQAAMKILEQIFFSTKIDDICTEVKKLLHDEKYQNVARVYNQARQFPSVNKKLKDLIENHFFLKGTERIACISAETIDDPKLYVQTILDIREKFLVVMEENFGCDPNLSAVLDKVCVKFINNNAVTEAAGNATKSAELLARFCDTLLRKGEKMVQAMDVENILDQIVILFNYLEDKDAFQKFYSVMLAKRVVAQLIASDEYEEAMISKLKQTHGFDHGNKLQRMLNDVQISKDLIEQYRTFCEEKQLVNIVNFQVTVLSSNSWPFSASPNFNIPIELKPTFDSFTQFYSERYRGRKLTWLHSRSKGELEMYLTKQKYVFQVSMYQMGILLLYNKSLNWTVGQIQEETQIQTKFLLPILYNLLKCKLLKCDQIGEENLMETNIKMDCNIQLASDFKSKKIRINLNVPLKLVEQKDIENAHQTVDEDRKLYIQAAIVRIMKARQTLKYIFLIQEVVQQLSSRFKPNIPQIKKCIDILIEKEYLERHMDDKDILRYVA